VAVLHMVTGNPLPKAVQPHRVSLAG